MKPYSTSLRLKEIMSKHNLKQIDILNACKPLCNKYNVKFGKSDLSQYISGKVEPGQEKLSVLAEALKVSEAWLMGYDVPMQDYESERIGTGIKNQPTPEGEPGEDMVVVHRNGKRLVYHITDNNLDSILPLLETLEAKSDPDL